MGDQGEGSPAASWNSRECELGGSTLESLGCKESLDIFGFLVSFHESFHVLEAESLLRAVLPHGSKMQDSGGRQPRVPNWISGHGHL